MPFWSHSHGDIGISHAKIAPESLDQGRGSIMTQRERGPRVVLDRSVVVVQHHQPVTHDITSRRVVYPIRRTCSHQERMTTLTVRHRCQVVVIPALRDGAVACIIGGYSRWKHFEYQPSSEIGRSLALTWWCWRPKLLRVPKNEPRSEVSVISRRLCLRISLTDLCKLRSSQLTPLVIHQAMQETVLHLHICPGPVVRPHGEPKLCLFPSQYRFRSFGCCRRGGCCSG